MRETSAGIIIYRQAPEGVKFLLLYHGRGYWNFAKGKLEEGEKSFRAAVREVKEETGINFRDLRFKEYFRIYDKYIFMRERGQVFKLVVFYLAESRTSRVVVSEEHDGYAWFLYNDALRRLRYKNLRVILKRAYEAIRGKGLQSSEKDPGR